MLSFDFIDAAGKAYQFVWGNRSYLARVALPVIFVKITCLLGIFIVGAQSNFLMQGIIRMPSLALEAFFAIGLIRYFLYHEPIFTWGKLKQPSSTEKMHSVFPLHGPYTVKQAYLGGIIIYMLIGTIQYASTGFMLDNEALFSATPEPSEEPSALLSTGIMIATLLALVWAFRLMWLHIPVALGVPARTFLKCARGLNSSSTMILTWLLCVFPVLFLTHIFSGIVKGFFPDQSPANIIAGYIVESCFEMIMISVVMVGLTIGIRQIIFGKEIQK